MARLVRDLDRLIARFAVVVMSLAPVAVACDDSSPIGPSSELVGVILVDKCSSVVVGESCTATARAFGPDGELSDPLLFWHSSDSRIFSVTGASSEATVTGRTPGSGTMSVGNRNGSVSAESPVRVIPQRM